MYEKASSGSPTETVLATSTNRIWHKDDSSTSIKNPAPSTVASQYWNHVAVTFNGSTNTGQIWVDGVADSTFTKSSAWTFTDTTCSIGKDNVNKSGWYTGRHWFGNMQQLRLVKGTAVYTSAFTPPQEALEAISGTSLLTFQENTAAKPNSTTAPLDVSGNNRSISGTQWNQAYIVMSRPWV